MLLVTGEPGRDLVAAVPPGVQELFQKRKSAVLPHVVVCNEVKVAKIGIFWFVVPY